ncbi:DNA polymerase phi-domain-containing protein [Phlyctochytrium arcticum]|nr:DNA polymerase phi-domain-containing protein [Phlyctochytrium arcticum]
MSNDMMALYWELASLDSSIRLRAAEKLTTSLAKFQESVPAPAKNVTVTEENLEKFCAPDVLYGYKRLLRGLPSSRDGARQGFSVALTELLRNLSFLSVSTVLAMLLKLTQIEGANGQEERDILFARIFGILAICEADLVSRDTTTLEDIQNMVQHLLKYSAKKVYVKEICTRVLLTIMDKVKGTPLEQDAIKFAIPLVLEKQIETPEDLWFALEMQKRYPDFQWEEVLPSWKHGLVLHQKNKSKLVETLKETSITTPRLHSIWTPLLAQLTAKKAPIAHAVSLHDLWLELDEALFSSSYERRFLGFMLFQKLLTEAKPSDVGYIFTPQLLRTMMHYLSKKDSYLHKIAKQTAQSLAKLAQERKDIALQLVLQLVGKNGHHRFDSVTKTKTLETIIGSLEQEDVESYVKYLQATFINPNEDLNTSQEVAEDDAEKVDPTVKTANAVEERRQWALDQIVLLLRNNKLAKKESWVKSAARFVTLHAAFDVKKNSTKNELIRVPVPEISDATRKVCEERLVSVLGTLVTLNLKPASGSDATKKPVVGVMENGQFWVEDLVKFVEKLKEDKHVSTLLEAADDDFIATMANARKTLADIQKETAKLSKDRDARAQHRAFELLFMHVLLQMDVDPSEYMDTLEDLLKCRAIFVEESDKTVKTNGKAPKKPKNDKKRKTDDMEVDEENDEEPPTPIEVLVDILISFLAKPSALFRSLSQDVFKAFCKRMNQKALDLIFDILATKGGVSGAEELFEGQDVGDDVKGNAMDVDGDEEGSGDDDEEEEDSDASDDGNEEDDDKNEEVDEDLRRDVRAALGRAAMGEDGDASESDEEEFLDDDEMEDFDNKLVEIFKQKKMAKTAKKDVKQQVLHFKFRVVDLLDILIKKAADSPLILETIMPLLKLATSSSRSTDDKELFTKLEPLMHRLFKNKEVPTQPELDVEHATKLLREVHEYAMRANDGTIFGLCSGASLYLTKVLSHVKEQKPAEVIAAPKSKKSKKSKTEVKPPTPSSELSRVASIYKDSLVDFLISNKSRVRPILFLELAKRYPTYIWELLPTYVELTSLTSPAKSYPRAQAYNAIALIFQQLPKTEEAERTEAIKQFLPGFVENVVGTLKLELSEDDSESNGRALGKDRTKSFMKDLVVVARRSCKVIGDEKQVAKLWRVQELQPLIEKLVASEKYQSVNSVKTAAKQLIRLLNPVEEKA